MYIQSENYVTPRLYWTWVEFSFSLNKLPLLMAHNDNENVSD